MKPALIIGIDPSTQKMSAVVSDVDGGDLEMFTKPLPKDPAVRLLVAEQWAFSLVLTYVQRGYEVYVFLEKSIMWRGSRSTVSLGEMNGAVAAGVQRAKPYHFGFVNNSTWKKQVVGAGKVDKPRIMRHVKLYWGLAYKMGNRDQDLADAACINRYGAGVVKRKRQIRQGNILRPVKRV